MNTSVRLVLDIALRSIVVLALTEAVAAAYASENPGDDGLGTGLTAMFAMACVAALWGVWDGFHRRPVPLCVTWVATGLLVSLGTTVYSHLRYGEWSWSLLADDLASGFFFFAGLVFVPAIVSGIAQSLTGRSPEPQKAG